MARYPAHWNRIFSTSLHITTELTPLISPLISPGGVYLPRFHSSKLSFGSCCVLPSITQVRWYEWWQWHILPSHPHWLVPTCITPRNQANTTPIQRFRSVGSLLLTGNHSRLVLRALPRSSAARTVTQHYYKLKFYQHNHGINSHFLGEPGSAGPLSFLPPLIPKRNLCEQVCFQLLTSTVNVMLPTFAAEPRCSAIAAEHRRPQHTTAIDRYLLPAWCSAANPPAAVAAVDQCDRQLDRRKLDHFTDPVLHTVQAASIRATNFIG